MRRGKPASFPESVSVSQEEAIVNNITVSGVRYPGTVVYKAVSEYPVSTDVEIKFDVTYSSGSSSASFEKTLLLKEGQTSIESGGQSGYRLLNGQCTPERYGNQIFNVILGEIVQG